MVVVKGWGKSAVGSYYLQSMGLQFGKMIKVLKMDSGEGCPTVRMYLMLLNCTLENS